MAQEKIRLGLLPFSESLGAVIAERQGFFKAEGLDVEVTKFESGALAVPVLQSGRIDIAFSNTVSTLQAIEQGLDAILLAHGPHRAQRHGEHAEGPRGQARGG
jgi:NitT/TauT family transport system substrate-binding protein